MRICFVIGALKFSGAEKVLSIIMEELARYDVEVHVILLEKDYGLPEKENGLWMHGAKAHGSRIFRIFNRWSLIRNIVRDSKPDIIVSFGFVCNINTLASLLGSRIPIVVCERNDPEHDPREYIQKVERAVLYRLASGYVFQTQTIRNYFLSFVKRKPSLVVANPLIDPGLKWDEESAENRFITVARLDDYQKDQYMLMKAFARFHEENPSYVLEFYGDGPDRRAYELFLEQQGWSDFIKLRGRVSNPLNRMTTAKAFILSSRYEGMPNALMEAMSIGIPCISTDCGGGGAKEVFGMCMAPSGILTARGDQDELTDAMCNLIQNPSMMVEMGKNARAILAKCEKGAIGKTWLNFLQTVIREHKR